MSFPEYPGHKVYGQVANSSLTTPTAFLVHTLEEIIAFTFDHSTASHVDVCPGAPDLSLKLPDAHPYPILICSLTAAQQNLLLHHEVLATESGAAFFYPFAESIPQKFLHFTLTGIVLESDEQGINNRLIAKELCNILIKEVEFHKFVDKHCDFIAQIWNLDDNIQGFMHKSIPLHNVYLPATTIAPNVAEDPLKAVKKIKFRTTKGLGTLANPFLCNTCKSIDHPEASCAYAKLEGWPSKRPAPPPTCGGYSRGYSGNCGGGSRGGCGGYRGDRGRGTYHTTT
ncbi:hypothetical protein M422DRAFT_274994 [Sphaerobolus stellatus SS14]|uniref:Uncharacterized protein n=1 Tax=Sphaerobolus stellatus (strain SS14) TaxID=990650 RepID=A0A0C9UGC5_SPHS4|nr:hypothetical protein M422DRAFT_274994 [Sphaerobolus stellatus SS14]